MWKQNRTHKCFQIYMACLEATDFEYTRCAEGMGVKVFILWAFEYNRTNSYRGAVVIFNQKRSWEHKRWPKRFIEGESTGGRMHHCGAFPVPHFHFWGRHRFKFHTKPLHQATYSVAFHHPYTGFMGSGAILANQ